MKINMSLYIELLEAEVERLRTRPSPRSGAVSSLLGVSPEDMRATEVDFAPKRHITSDMGTDANGSPAL